MNYQKIYKSIIDNAISKQRVKLKKTNTKYAYFEEHHIIPKCIGGSNEEANLVLLTAREHFVCHKLLTYIYKNRKIVCAFFRMAYDSRNRKVSSRDFEYLKELISSISHTKETKNKISVSLQGVHQSIETRKKRSETNKIQGINVGAKNPMFGKSPWNKDKINVYSDETIVKMKKPKSEEHKAKLRKPKSEEHKAKLRKQNNKSWICNSQISILLNRSEIELFLNNNPDFQKGRIISEEQRQKCSDKMKGRIPWNKKS